MPDNLKPPSPEFLAQLEKRRGEDRRVEVVVLTSIFMVLAFTGVVLRLLARRKMAAPLKADDWMVIIAMLPVLATCICTFVLVHAGLGLHIVRIPSFVRLAKLGLATQVTYGLALMPLKLSILCLYRRIFPSVQLRRAALLLETFVVAYVTVQVICMLAQCVPMSLIWQPGPGHCLNYAAALTTFSILNISTDMIMLVMPIPVLWNLNIKRNKKWQLMASFGLGFIVTSVSVVRTVFVAANPASDQSWNYVRLVLVSVAEVCLGVLSACLPTFRPLFVKDQSKVWSSEEHVPSQEQAMSRRSAARRSQHGLSQHNVWIRLREKEQGMVIDEKVARRESVASRHGKTRCQTPVIHIRTDIEVTEVDHERGSLDSIDRGRVDH